MCTWHLMPQTLLPIVPTRVPHGVGYRAPALPAPFKLHCPPLTAHCCWDRRLGKEATIRMHNQTSSKPDMSQRQTQAEDEGGTLANPLVKSSQFDGVCGFDAENRPSEPMGMQARGLAQRVLGDGDGYPSAIRIIFHVQHLGITTPTCGPSNKLWHPFRNPSDRVVRLPEEAWVGVGHTGASGTEGTPTALPEPVPHPSPRRHPHPVSPPPAPPPQSSPRPPSPPSVVRWP